jgi:hypothetical protein
MAKYSNKEQTFSIKKNTTIRTKIKWASTIPLWQTSFFVDLGV